MEIPEIFRQQLKDLVLNWISEMRERGNVKRWFLLSGICTLPLWKTTSCFSFFKKIFVYLALLGLSGSKKNLESLLLHA